MQSEGPSESDMNNLGIYLLFSFSFVMAALLELFVLVILSGRARPQHDGESGNAVEPYNDSVENGLEEGNALKSIISASDKWAFWLFNFAFIIFNCGYWMICLA